MDNVSRQPLIDRLHSGDLGFCLTSKIRITALSDHRLPVTAVRFPKTASDPGRRAER